ncbi:MAG: hypothetical protein VKJ24_02640 [Synechococcales bacterium]|nr:hypothetical protein [Synechococcales bacterium]
MAFPLSYILLLAQQPHQAQVLVSLFRDLCDRVAIAVSEAQAIDQLNQAAPFLIVLSGDPNHWSGELLRHCRTYDPHKRTTLVALTDFHTPRWVHPDENPGFDGFLVTPLSHEVVTSLVESAYTRHACFLATSA